MAQPSEEPTPRRQAKRDQIRTGAQRLFLERGFAATSTDAIAYEAGVSKRTLYAYYPTKEQLLSDVLIGLIGEGPTDWLPQGSAPSVSSREELRSSLLELAQRMVHTLMQPEYLALVRVIVAETPRMPQLGAVFREAVPARGMQSVSMLLESAQRQGIAHVADMETAARMFAGTLLTYVLLGGLLEGAEPVHPPAPERIQEMVSLYMKAILVEDEAIAIEDSATDGS